MKRKITFLIAAAVMLLLNLFSWPTMSYGQTWEKVSSIAEDDVIVIVTEFVKQSTTYKYELTGITTSGTRYGVGTEYQNAPEGTSYPLTVKAGYSNGTYAFKNGNNYLNYSGSSNTLNTNTTLSNNTSWTVSFSGTDATIKNVASNTRQLLWNSGSPRFACYTGQTPGSGGYYITSIYKKINPALAFTGTTTHDAECTGTNSQSFAGSYVGFASFPSLNVAFYASAESNADQLTGNEIPDWIEFSSFTGSNGTFSNSFTVSANDGEERHAYFKVYSGNTYTSNIYTVNQAAAPTPDYTVTLSNNEISSTYAGGIDNSITVSNNLTGEEIIYEVQYNQGNNPYSPTPNPYSSWFSAIVTDNKLVCTIQPNSTGTERSAMVKVYAIDDNYDEAYSEVVTITQTPVAAPELDPDGGTYHGTVNLTMTTETLGASIYYTIGNEIPDNKSTLYDAQNKPVIGEGTYNAIACAMVSSTPIYSDITTVTFTQEQVATPTFSPVAGDVYDGATITIFCATDGATIQYSTDNGNNWTTGTSLTINAATTIKAKATKTGYATSDIASAAYTISEPKTVAWAIANTPSSGTSQNYFIHGIVSKFQGDDIMDDGDNYRYYISDDGTTTSELQVYRGKGLNNVAFSSADDLSVGDEVIVYGGLTKYNSTKEIAANNYIVYLFRDPKILCSNMSLAWNQTSDETLAIMIHATGGVLAAETNDSWFNVSVNGTIVSVTTTQNESSTPRNGTVSLTYTYNTKETIEQEITITQAAKPALCRVYFNVNGSVTMTTDVPQGEELDLGNFKAPVVSNTYDFYGWTATTSPITKINSYTPEENQTTATLYAIYGSGSYVLVTNVNTLTAGSKVVIANSAKTCAISTTQNENNRGEASITYSNNTLTLGNGVCELTLGEGTADDSWSFYDSGTSKGYLYAASSSKNYLRTESSLSANSSFSVTITNNGTTLVANGSNSNKNLKYNSSNSIFSCYGTNYSTGDYCSIFQKAYSSFTLDIGNLEPTTSMSNIPENAVIVVNDGTILTLTGDNNGYETSLIIEDGGQLITTNPVAATFKKTIESPNSKTDVYGWYTISSPVHDDGTPNEILISNIPSLTSVDYDMLAYDEVGHTWRNQKAGSGASGFTTMNKGQGYMYRNAGSEISFVGNTNVGDITNSLTYTDAAGDLAGFHLVGNPYSHNITLMNTTLLDNVGDPLGTQLSGCYILTKGNAWGSALNTSAIIKPEQGFLIQITSADAKKIQFSETPRAAKSRSNGDNIEFIVANSEYEDNTFALFDNAMGLNKIEHRNTEVPMIYIPQNGTNYAIAPMSDNTKSFNLNFKAKSFGQYTLRYKATGEFSYLHVIDRLTGEDVDILLEGEYSFVASPDDTENRFIVRLEYSAGSENPDSSIFAYQNGNDIVVNGEGELQIFDVMGRMVGSQRINGVQTINIPLRGVYIFRLNEKTQKIVIE